LSSLIDLYVEKNEARFLDELLTFLRIPSISTLPEHKQDVARAAQFVADALKAAGVENIEIIPTNNHPLVYGDLLHAPGKPTVLCYGHYDVQPPDPLELWKSPPFEPVIEGEEEIGGESISKYVPQHKEKLKADAALVSDTELFADGLPTLCIGLRGLLYLEVEARGAARDLHSGVFGGAAPNAVFGLIELLAKAKDADGRIKIPGIYDDVTAPDAAEVESWRRLPFSEKEFLESGVGATALTGEPDQSVLARIWARPTLEVHGIAGGFTGAGAKTVIPATAVAKVSLRLVPEQKYEAVLQQFREWVRANTPKGIQIEVRLLSGGPAILVNPNHPALQIAAKAFSDKLQKPTVFTRSGGSIPIVGEFAKELGIPSILMGFGLPDDGLHSPNEKYRLSNYYCGIQTIAYFLDEYAKTR
jgi:acetylornithine deacetylase/succinyl-diaminopimelate desuccinylase-like protein